MGSHGARRGDDDVWARVRAGDVDSVADHVSLSKRENRRTNTLKEQAATAMHGEMWFDEKLGHSRRRRTSVTTALREVLNDDAAPLHEVDVDEQNARQYQFATPHKKQQSLSDRQTELLDRQTEAEYPTNGNRVPEESDRRGLAVGSLFDHIFVRPMAPQNIRLKYARFTELLPLLKVTHNSHGRGESNVATHVRNATTLTKAYQKYRDIDPNLLLTSYNDKVKIRQVAEDFIHSSSSTSPTLSSRKLANSVRKVLHKLESSTFSLTGIEKNQCFSSKFKEPKRRRKKRKRKRKKAKKNKNNSNTLLPEVVLNALIGRRGSIYKEMNAGVSESEVVQK